MAAIGFGVSAQSVVITEKDGTTHKFCTDYVENITFEEIEVYDGIVFTACSANPYSGGNVGLSFSGEGLPAVELDVYSSATAGYLTPGSYTVDATSGEMTVSTDQSYSNITIDSNKLGLKSGTMTVALEGSVYTIDMNFELTDASAFKGRWTGEISNYGPVVSFAATACKQTEPNDQVDGEFYLKLNDDNWSFEATLDFYAAAGSAILPDGEYTLAETKAAGTFGSRSQIDLYSPYNTTVKFTNPIIVKTVDGKKVIETTQVMENGRTLNFSFTGDITYK